MPNIASVRVVCIIRDPEIAHIIQEKLQPLNFVVDSAINVEQGLAIYNAAPCNLIILEEQSPGDDGVQRLRQLAVQGSMPPTIMIVGDTKAAIEALKSGADDYVVRDADGAYLELLPIIVDRLLQKQRLVDAQNQNVQTLDQNTKTLALLKTGAQAISEAVEVNAIVEQVLKAAVQLANAAEASVWLWANEPKTLLRSKAVYRDGHYDSHIIVDLSPEQGVVGQVARATRSFTVACTIAESLQYPEFAVYKTPHLVVLLAVPLLVHDKLIGVLEVTNDNPDRFDATTTIALETLVAPAAIALENARLVDVLDDRAHELNARHEELDAFSHTVSHDLKNSLNVTLASAQYLKRKYGTTFDDVGYKSLEEVELTSLRMRSTIGELLLLATIRKAEIKMEPLNMSAIVAEAINRLDEIIREYCPDIVVPVHWPAALGQGPWIEEVWVNYLTNAIKYGGQVPRVELGATPVDNDKVRFWVRDNGTGITAEEQAQLFAPVTRPDQEGHGLGLAIARRIVEKLGGQTSVESIVGRGSTFSFTLPQANK